MVICAFRRANPETGLTREEAAKCVVYVGLIVMKGQLVFIEIDFDLPTFDQATE